MKVLADASVWLPALRSQKSGASPTAEELKDLVRESLVVLIGPVRQALLSGISDDAVFHALKSKLEALPDVALTARDYETAAEFCNLCRKRGLSGPPIDFLVCASAHNHGLLIFSADPAFARYAKRLPIRLLKLE
ncbi:MAG: PIN domain-containing protein [Clostridiales bacterium]|jgi:predicted nucleic acid-binding protein|nr:PIN domain-containing protein [Clostridiales bacterium]